MSGSPCELPRDAASVDNTRRQLPSFSHRPPSDQATRTEIAPWATEGPFSGGDLPPGTFFENSNGRRPRPSSFRPDTARSGASDSPDPIFCGEERRPSLVSATSASSQNSNPRASIGRSAHHKKLAGFFAADGRDSSRSSDTSIAATNKRDHSESSHTRRNDSVYTQNSTEGPPTSASSSRPRTPPSSDVTPWLFQDFKVSTRVRVCVLQSCQVCFSTQIGQRMYFVQCVTLETSPILVVVCSILDLYDSQVS